MKRAKCGRPTKFKREYCEQATKLCLLGATDIDLANFFETSERTVNSWKTDHPEFLEAMRAGKEQADAEVAKKLYHRACGYSHPEVHVSNYQGEITLTPLTKHYPPDTLAARLWLINRQPKKWRDKQNHVLAGDDDGGPIRTQAPTATDYEALRAAVRASLLKQRSAGSDDANKS